MRFGFLFLGGELLACRRPPQVPTPKPTYEPDLASDRFQGRFDLGDNSVRVLFVELMSALERRLATARGNAQPGRLLLYGLVALCGGDDHERNGAKRQETPRSATMRSTQLTCSGFLHPRGPGNSFSRSPVVGGPTSSKTTPATRAG